MKKSFMNNLKNFVDSNVRHRIDRVTNNSGNNSNSDPLNDDLLLVERHFDDLRQFCIDTEKKISNMLQSTHLSSATPSQLGAYTQNVQAGLNNLSHNLAQQAVNITSSTSSNMSGSNNAPSNVIPKSGDDTNKNSSTSKMESNAACVPDQLPCRLGTITTAGDKAHVMTLQTHNRELRSNVSTELKYDTLQRFKKLPIVAFYKSLCKSSNKLKQDSLLATTLTYCSKMQAQLTNLYLVYEQMISTQCLNPIQQMLEIDIPYVLKLKKSYIKAHNDLESIKAKYNGVIQKQHQQQSVHFNNTSYLVSQNSIQQNNTNKLELLKNELDESVSRFEQSKDTYEAELFTFVCREPELVNLLRLFYQLQSDYHQRVIDTIQNSLPAIDIALDRVPRKFVFGSPLNEHIRCTGRRISPVIELCVYFLHCQGLQEEGLFRIPGSSVKIKKLKNGINALFLTLMSLSELEKDQQRESGHSCIISLHDLFKSAVGQRPQKEHQIQLQIDGSSFQNSVLRSSLAVDESPMSYTNNALAHNYDNASSQGDGNNDEYIMDVHSIAGLLKLYLRELPEPLFTHALYDNWISCISDKSDSNEKRINLLSDVLKQLPGANYENLKHLIKFLNRLTHFQEQNKMTSTNLAIAMAPSLLWPRPSNQDEQQSDITSNSDDAQTLNLQMCSFGLSATQHAMILETLINHADILFPEPSDFQLSEFNNLSLTSSVSRCTSSTHESRNVKSTSPTGLSTASSSSFSSNASASATSTTANKGHSRKGGSMEGLLGGIGGGQEAKGILQPNMSTRSIGRPVSVHIRQNDYSSVIRQDNIRTTSAVPQSKPPIPIARCHMKTTGDIKTTLNSSHKPPAPPVPPPTSVRHQQERLKKATATLAIDSKDQLARKPRPVSLRGTGTIEQLTSTSGNHLKTRPSVPPPKRPASVAKTSEHGLDTVNKCKLIDDIDSKSINSMASTGGNMRNDLDKPNIHEATNEGSPVLSLDGLSANDDSSFDNSEDDNVSVDSSSCKEPSTFMEHQSNSGTLKQLVDADKRSFNAIKVDVTMKGTTDDAGGVSREEVGRNEDKISSADSTKPEPPAKPPRSASPKSTQFTPL